MQLLPSLWANHRYSANSTRRRKHDQNQPAKCSIQSHRSLQESINRYVLNKSLSNTFPSLYPYLTRVKLCNYTKLWTLFLCKMFFTQYASRKQASKLIKRCHAGFHLQLVHTLKVAFERPTWKSGGCQEKWTIKKCCICKYKYCQSVRFKIETYFRVKLNVSIFKIVNRFPKTSIRTEGYAIVRIMSMWMGI